MSHLHHDGWLKPNWVAIHICIMIVDPSPTSPLEVETHACIMRVHSNPTHFCIGLVNWNLITLQAILVLNGWLKPNYIETCIFIRMDRSFIKTQLCRNPYPFVLQGLIETLICEKYERIRHNPHLPPPSPGGLNGISIHNCVHHLLWPRLIIKIE
jgi:hypothetical protein